MKERTRRQWLSVLASGTLVAVAGCGGDGDTETSPSGTRTTTKFTTSEDSPTATIREGSLSEGEKYRAESGLVITVSSANVRRGIELNTGSKKAPKNEMYVAVQVAVRNEADAPQQLPAYDSFSLISGSIQYDPVNPRSFFGDQRVTDPGKLYSQIDDAHKGVEETGWILFQVPRSTATAEVAWSSQNLIGENESAIWAVSIEPDSLPAFSTPTVRLKPSEPELNQALTLQVEVSNTGGSSGIFTTPYTLNLPAEESQDGMVRVEVPAGESRIWTAQVSPIALGQVQFSVPDVGKADSVRVLPARRDWGQTFVSPFNLELTSTEPLFAQKIDDELEYSGPMSADAGSKFMLTEVFIRNPTNGLRYAPAVDEFSLTSGQSTFEPSELDELSIQPTLTQPVSGETYTTLTGAMNGGTDLAGWLVFEIPDSLTASDLILQADWAAGSLDDFPQAVYWSG